MKEKNILQLTGMASFKFGALEHYFLNLTRECNKRGYRTVLQYEGELSSDEYKHDLMQEKAQIVMRRTWTNPLFSLAHCFYLISKFRPEIVHVHFVSKYAKMVIPFLARLFGVKKVLVTVHNKPGYIKKHPSRWAYNQYDVVLPVSKAVVDDLVKGGVNPEIVSPLYLGLFGERSKDREHGKELRQKLSIPEGAVVLGCIAFEAKFKGVDILLEAIKRVVESGKNVYLIQVGVDLSVKELISMADRLGIADRVKWMGVIDQGWRALSAADIYVQPSRSEEGLPLAVMEAMSMKLPIVCTDVSGNREAVLDRENGLITKNTPEDLAQGILKMISASDEWERYGAAGYGRFKELFDGNQSIMTLISNFYLKS